MVFNINLMQSLPAYNDVFVVLFYSPVKQLKFTVEVVIVMIVESTHHFVILAASAPTDASHQPNPCA